MDVPYSRSKLRKPMVLARLTKGPQIPGLIVEVMPGCPITLEKQEPFRPPEFRISVVKKLIFNAE